MTSQNKEDDDEDDDDFGGKDYEKMCLDQLLDGVSAAVPYDDGGELEEDDEVNDGEGEGDLMIDEEAEEQDGASN